MGYTPPSPRVNRYTPVKTVPSHPLDACGKNIFNANGHHKKLNRISDRSNGCVDELVCIMDDMNETNELDLSIMPHHTHSSVYTFCCI